MARAHVCMTCGLDLARLRVQRDPHYQLPLVICPQCGSASVRRRHPIVTRFRQARRVVVPLVVIAIQLPLIALFGFLNLMSTFVLVMVALDVPKMRDPDERYWMIVLAIVVLPIITGTWLTVGFHHHKRWRVWMGWFVLMMAPIIVLGWTLAASEEFAIADGAFGALGLPYSASIALSTMLFSIVAACLLLMILAVALVGIPVGRCLLWIHASCRGALWRLRLRRARRWRTA